jgi:hypothetical protein
LRDSRRARVGRYSLPGNRFLSGFRHYNNEKRLRTLEAVSAQALTEAWMRLSVEVQLRLLFPCCCTKTDSFINVLDLFRSSKSCGAPSSTPAKRKRAARKLETGLTALGLHSTRNLGLYLHWPHNRKHTDAVVLHDLSYASRRAANLTVQTTIWSRSAAIQVIGNIFVASARMSSAEYRPEMWVRRSRFTPLMAARAAASAAVRWP